MIEKGEEKRGGREGREKKRRYDRKGKGAEARGGKRKRRGERKKM